MINILSLRCALAFAPYLAESAEEFINEKETTSRVARQGGNGLIIRSDGKFLLRHQDREAAISEAEANHYRAAIQFRIAVFEIERMQDEVVMSSFDGSLVLSFPQSEMWLDAGNVSEIIRAYETGIGDISSSPDSSLPDWLNISTAANRLLLSDQRNGRWVLLGADHVDELKRRLGSLQDAASLAARVKTPVIPIKGINVHLQSAFRLADVLEQFADTGNVAEFEHATAGFRLTIARATEGIELRDTERRVALTKREARKWADIIRAELERLRATEMERGAITTVFADGESGRWVLQWGDEVFVSNEALAEIRATRSSLRVARAGGLVFKQDDDFLLLLSEQTGACVALEEAEAHFLLAVNTPLG